MNYKMMGRFVAQMLFIETIFMVPALIISACYGEIFSVQGFLFTIASMLAVEGILWLLCKSAPNALNAKEGLVCVGISWIVMSLLGCLPFVLSGAVIIIAAVLIIKVIKKKK